MKLNVIEISHFCDVILSRNVQAAIGYLMKFSKTNRVITVIFRRLNFRLNSGIASKFSDFPDKPERHSKTNLLTDAFSPIVLRITKSV